MVLGPHGTKASRLEYDRLITEWLANGRTLSVTPSSDSSESLTVTQLCVAYLKWAKSYYRDEHVHNGNVARIKPILKELREMYGKQLASEFGPLKLKSVRQRLIERQLTRANINTNIGRIKRMFRWAVSEELVHPDVSNAIAALENLKRGRSEAKESRKIEPIEPDHVEAAIQELPETLANMVWIQLLLGCRPGELCKIRPCDIDRTEDVWKYRPAGHKTAHHGKSRVIHIGPKAQEILTPYLLRPADSFCFSPAESEKKRLAVIHAKRKTPISCGNRPGTNRKKKPCREKRDFYTTVSYHRAIERACEKAGVPKWTPHRLRHTAGTEIRKRYGLEAAQVALGHSNARITEVYAERDMALAAKVAREVG